MLVTNYNIQLGIMKTEAIYLFLLINTEVFPNVLLVTIAEAASLDC